MNCPICGGKSLVADCRRDGETIYRMRVCKDCGNDFYSVEVDSTYEEFHRVKSEYHRKYHEERKGR